MTDEYGPLLRDLFVGDASTLRAFLDLQVAEGPSLDYRREPPADLADVVASMANTGGGTIIIGVGQDRSRKTPIDSGGWSASDPGGQITSSLRSVLDPVPAHEVAIIPGDPTDSGEARNYAIVLVHPSTHRAVLHREKGLRVRVGDQCSAPTRFDFERLIAREATRSDDVRRTRDAVETQAALNAHPGAAQDQLYLYVVVRPIEAQDVQLDEAMDRAFKGVAEHLLPLAFMIQTGPDFTQLDAMTDWVRLERSGKMTTRMVVHAVGGTVFPAVFAYDLVCLLTASALIPLALSEVEPRLRWTTFVATCALGGYQGVTVEFGRSRVGFSNAQPPPDLDATMTLMRSAVISAAADVLPMTQQLVIDFARARQVGGTDTWRVGLAGRLHLDYPPLAPWEGKLG